MHSAKFLRLLILGVALQTAGIAAQTGEDGVPFSVLTYNIENGGAQVDFAKTIEVIRKSGADVVGIQEAWGSTAALAEAMGWDGSISIPVNTSSPGIHCSKHRIVAGSTR